MENDHKSTPLSVMRNKAATNKTIQKDRSMVAKFLNSSKSSDIFSHGSLRTRRLLAASREKLQLMNKMLNDTQPLPDSFHDTLRKARLTGTNFLRATQNLKQDLEAKGPATTSGETPKCEVTSRDTAISTSMDKPVISTHINSDAEQMMVDDPHEIYEDEEDELNGSTRDKSTVYEVTSKGAQDVIKKGIPVVNLERMVLPSKVTPNQQPKTDIEEKSNNLTDQFVDTIKNLKVDLLQTCEMVKDLHIALTKSAGVFQIIEDATVENLRKSKGDINAKAATTVKQNAECIQEPIEEKDKHDKRGNRKNGKESTRNETDDDDGIEDDAPAKSRGHIRSFVLPPEYDPDDSRWCLKNRTNNRKSGLIELITDSNVYIDPIMLAHCKRVAKDSKMLARMLFVEIFTQSALSVCSLTGARANAFSTDVNPVRPGLDEHARVVILNYVEEYARKKGWMPYDHQAVVNSVRSKVQEIRAKYGQTG